MIREYCIDDIPFIYEGLKYYKTGITPEYLEKVLRIKISNYLLYPEYKIYIYEQQGNVKGFIVIHSNYIDWETGFQYILVEEFYSESQIGAYRLMKYVEEIAKKQKKNIMGLTRNDSLMKNALRENWEVDLIQYIKKWEDVYETQ